MKTAIVLYEKNHLAFLDALILKYRVDSEKPIVVSLDAEIDYALEKRDVPFISGKTLQNRTAPESYLRSDELTRDICDDKSLSFLNYRGVSLIEPLRFSIRLYLIDLLYYIDVIDHLIKNVPDIECLVIPSSTIAVLKTSGSLAEEETKIVYEAARLVTEGNGILCKSHDTLSVALHMKNGWYKRVFSLKRTLFAAALSFLNALIALRPRKSIRLLASDYWRNIAPVMRELPEAELILIDRKEAIKAGLKNIWRHKIQFLHIEHFLSRSGKKRVLAHAKKINEEWNAARKKAWASVDLTFRGANLFSTAERIISHLVEKAVQDVISDIEGSYSMYERLSPDVVLLRVSVNKQRHFGILPLVAHEKGIPAFEMQHGTEYLGSGSATRRLAADYLVEYGKIFCDELTGIGYAQERLFAAGSPRFDSYIRDVEKASARHAEKDITVLSNTPTMSVGERYGTYSVEEYFKALGNVVRQIPNSRLLVTTRSTSVRSAFSEEARARGLENANYENVGDSPLPGLFQRSDIFVCSFSTVVYEALLYRLPVIISAFAPVEKMMTDFHFSKFQNSGALFIAHSPEELSDMLQKLSADPEARTRMSMNGWEFMKKNFSFDGHASERIAELIRNWSKRTIA
jgi:hypothetical protein